MNSVSSEWTGLLPGYFAVLTLLLMVGTVVSRVLLLRRKGVSAMHFGKIDKTDFLIPPFVLFYFYLVIAAAFQLPSVSRQTFFHSEFISWVGVFFCLAGLLTLGWSLVSFGRSFRVGIDAENPDQLVTSGVFAYSRNPLYVAFWAILFGQFLIFSNWILLIYLAAASWLFHRQVLREENYLQQHYGQDYSEYCHQVRRYV
jgi:protein-S-isoprenylcysteine O-methyltransferase Ste14